MENLIDFFSHHRKVAGIIFAAVVILEIRSGYLKSFKGYALTLKPGGYLKILFAAIFAALLLLFFDEALIRALQQWNHPVVTFLVSLGAFWGKSVNLWGILGLCYFFLWAFKREAWKRIVFSALVSSGLTALLIHFIKYAFMRARPYKGLGPHHFFDYPGWREHGNDFLSFASGDAAVTAGAASLFFLVVKNPARWIFPCAAILTCFARMYFDKHWPSDVTFSFLISFAFAKLTADYLKFQPQK